MGLKRASDWPSLLHAFFCEREKMPFLWGVHDCALFSCDGIRAMTGVDLAQEFRGRYKTAAGSARAIRSITGGVHLLDAAAYAAAMHDVRPVRPSMAGRGDWVLLPNRQDVTLGLVHLNGKDVIAVGEQGLLRLPLASAIAAWRI